jgi:hypothetical protein
MTREELQKVRDWADAKIATGEEPPWAWFQYMKLRENLDAILSGMDATCIVTVPEDSPQEAQRPGSGHLRLVGTCPPDSAQPAQSGAPVPLPM